MLPLAAPATARCAGFSRAAPKRGLLAPLQRGGQAFPLLRAAFTEPPALAASSELIRTLAARALSRPALRLLSLIAARPLTISAAVRALSRELPCATSTAWLAVKRLRALGLIENGRSQTAALTEHGLVLHRATEEVMA